MVEYLTCRRCGHKWVHRTENLPGTCSNPHCRSPYWNKDRIQVVKEVQTEKLCPACGLTKSVDEFYHKNTLLPSGPRSYISTNCKACECLAVTERTHKSGRNKPMSEAKNSGVYLGVHIAERVLSTLFEHVERTPFGFPGYDFLCGKGFKIDVKSACLTNRKDGVVGWTFHPRKNEVADYFLCVAFDARESLEPLHLWLIPGKRINHLGSLWIGAGKLQKWADYEKPLDKVIGCCDSLRQQ